MPESMSDVLNGGLRFFLLELLVVVQGLPAGIPIVLLLMSLSAGTESDTGTVYDTVSVSTAELPGDRLWVVSVSISIVKIE